MTRASLLRRQADESEAWAARLVKDGDAAHSLDEQERFRRQADTMNNYAAALRLEADTGRQHCVCCRLPVEDCPNRRAHAERKARGEVF